MTNNTFIAGKTHTLYFGFDATEAELVHVAEAAKAALDKFRNGGTPVRFVYIKAASDWTIFWTVTTTDVSAICLEG